MRILHDLLVTCNDRGIIIVWNIKEGKFQEIDKYGDEENDTSTLTAINLEYDNYIAVGPKGTSTVRKPGGGFGGKLNAFEIRGKF